MFDLTSLSLSGIIDFPYFFFLSFSNMLERDDISIIVLNKVEVEIGIISLYRIFPTYGHLGWRTVSEAF